MNITFGIMEEPQGRFRKKADKREQVAREALTALEPYAAQVRAFRPGIAGAAEENANE